MGEKEEAKRDGARLQSNSGRGMFSKGDARWFSNVIDYKDAKRSFGLTKKVWAKVCTDAYRVDRDAKPLLKVTLGEDSFVRLFVVGEDWMHELMETYEKYYDLLEEMDG